MKALVVYDSFFGNTEQVARAIGDALGSEDDTGCCRVGDVTPEDVVGLDLLVVGSPTRAFNPTKDVKSFIKRIPANGLKGTRVAAFDTRMSPADVGSRVYSFLEKRFGYAAEPVAIGLERKGGNRVVPAEGFFVMDTEGPLKEGELERAAEWGRRIVGAL